MYVLNFTVSDFIFRHTLVYPNSRRFAQTPMRVALNLLFDFLFVKLGLYVAVDITHLLSTLLTYLRMLELSD
jgi:hypothetical protein